MKIVSIREVSRHFTRHAELSRQGEEVRVYRDGKPYVRIIPDTAARPASAPRIDFAARAKKDLKRKITDVDLVELVKRNRR